MVLGDGVCGPFCQMDHRDGVGRSLSRRLQDDETLVIGNDGSCHDHVLHAECLCDCTITSSKETVLNSSIGLYCNNYTTTVTVTDEDGYALKAGTASFQVRGTGNTGGILTIKFKILPKWLEKLLGL